jgi:hypothetical protein
MRALPLLLLVPALAQATPLLVPLSRGVELKTQSLADPAQADLVVQSRMFSAPHGIRCVAGDAFGQSSPVVNGAACEVRDAGGSLYAVRVTAVTSVSVSLEVHLTGALSQGSEPAVPAPFDALPPSSDPGLLARFEMESFSVDGSPVSTRFPALVLHRDGSYVFGERKGRWSMVAGLLLLDGEYTGWGAGAVSADASRVTFHARGPRFELSVALARSQSPGVLLSQVER